MRLRVRHVAADGMGLESAVLQAKDPKAGAEMFAHRNYVAVGQRIDVMMDGADDRLNYKVDRSRCDMGGCRVQYMGKSA